MGLSLRMECIVAKAALRCVCEYVGGGCQGK